MKLVAFYQDTDGSNGVYAEHAKRLRTECKELGQDASIVKGKFGDDYLSITRGKPQFMLEQLDKHNEDLVYVDVDSHLLRDFNDLENLPTIAFAPKPNGRPYGHVMVLPNTDATREFLTAWAETVDGWEGGDHSAMWLTIKNLGYEWMTLPEWAERVEHVVSTHPDAVNAHAALKAAGWADTLRARLA